MRPGPGGSYTGVNKSAPQTFSDASDTTRTYVTQQAIAAGDLIALDAIGSSFALNNFDVLTTTAAGNTFVRWEPPLANAETRTPTSVVSPPASEVLVNAEVEPDCDSDGLGDETQDADTSSCNPPDTTPPDTTITGGPSGKTRKKSATFTYTGTDASGIAGFQCRLDEGQFESCPGSKTYSALKKGEHTFEVRAVDNAGNVDPTPAKRTWKVKKKKKKKKKK